MTAPQRNPGAVCGTCRLRGLSRSELLVEIDDVAREAALDLEALRRETAHLDSLIPQDDDGAHP